MSGTTETVATLVADFIRKDPELLVEAYAARQRDDDGEDFTDFLFWVFGLDEAESVPAVMLKEILEHALDNQLIAEKLFS
jgi:hypothetical protein